MELGRRQKIRLGLFVVASLSALLGGLLLAFGLKWVQPHHDFRIRFAESIAGLERNAAVRYQGLRVGHVDKLYIAADDPASIEVVISLDPHAALYAGTSAQLDMSGLTGLKNINLIPGDARRGRLPPGSVLPTHPSMMGKIADNASAILSDMRHIADQLGAFVNPNNRHALEHLVGSLDRLVGNIDGFLSGEKDRLRSTLGEAQQMTHAVRLAAEETASTVHDARAVMHHLDGEVAETLGALRATVAGVEGAQVQKTLQAMGGAASTLQARLSQAEAGASIQAFQGTMARVDNLVRDVDMAVRAGREDFSKSLSYMRQAAEDLREFSRILASNPSVLVRGRGEEP